MNILSILGKQLSQAMFSKYVFRLLHAPKSQISFTKLNMMVKVVKLFTVFYEKAALMNFTRKHLYGSLFFNKVSRIQAKKRPMHRCLPVSFTEYFRTLFLQNTSGWLLLLNTLFCSLRRPQQQKIFPLTLVVLNIFERNTVNFLQAALCGGPRQTVNCD